jgi:hypothetical protein
VNARKHDISASRSSERNALNRLLAIQRFSLANYVIQASPWTHSGNEPAVETLKVIVDDHAHYAQLLADAIDARDGLVESGSFPMSFASLSDLTLDYVLSQLIEYQHRDIQRIEQCVSELVGDPLAWSLASEVLGSERAHLEILKESLLPSGAANKDDTRHTQVA